MEGFQEALQGFRRRAGVLLALMGELQGEGKSPSVLQVVLDENLQLGFHRPSPSDGEGSQIREELIGMALEQEGILVPCSSKQLFLRVKEMQLDDNVPVGGGPSCWRWVRALWILSNSRRSIGMEGASSWNKAVEKDCRSSTVSGMLRIRKLDLRERFSASSKRERSAAFSSRRAACSWACSWRVSSMSSTRDSRSDVR